MDSVKRPMINLIGRDDQVPHPRQALDRVATTQGEVRGENINYGGWTGDVYRLIVKNYWTLHFSDIAPTEDHTSGGGEGRKESAVGEGKGGKSQLWGRGRKRSAVTSLICG